MQNLCYSIKPYFLNNELVFDDKKLNIKGEGLTCGTPDVILKAKNLKKIEKNFHITFYHFSFGKFFLNFVQKERDGFQYFWKQENMFCWFCPTFLRYFKKPPKILWFDVQKI